MGKAQTSGATLQVYHPLASSNIWAQLLKRCIISSSTGFELDGPISVANTYPANSAIQRLNNQGLYINGSPDSRLENDELEIEFFIVY